MENNSPQELKLYKAHEKIYPREVKGRFQNKRKLAVFVLLGLFYFLPWLTWDGQQAILFDLPNRRFHIFSLTLWPQDFIYLAWLLIIAAFSLFFFTALAGRLWCGFACPQTVWTEVFIWLEQITEGNNNKRKKLDKSAWTLTKFRKKFSKQFLWITFALWTGFTFVGFFTPIHQLSDNLMQYNLGPWETFWFLFYALATYGNAGYLREQVCLYMCPYARFQGAMFDQDSLIISYDEKRGEPRMRGKTRRASDSPGDCIDCTLCVQVCPTGIDIRDGLQYECIGCAACIDACDMVMEKSNMPKGLIKYTTEHSINNAKTKILRPRIIIYGLILLVLITSFAYSLYQRSNIDLNIIHDRNSLYRIVDSNTIENVYTVKIMNKGNSLSRYKITVEGLDSLIVKINDRDRDIKAMPNELISLPLKIQADKNIVTNKIYTIKVRVTNLSNENESVIEKVKYFGYTK
jgi:cytochrome c oxidase accessory protein FixG